MEDDPKQKPAIIKDVVMQSGANTQNADDSDPNITVLIVVDVETLLSSHADSTMTFEDPAIADHVHFYVLVARDDELLGRNDARIDLAAKPGDHIRIRAISLALRGEHSVLLHGITHAQSEVLAPFDLVLAGGLTVATPNADNLLEPGRQSIDDHFWQSQVAASGIAECDLDFMVLDTACAVAGYFRYHLQIGIAH